MTKKKYTFTSVRHLPFILLHFYFKFIFNVIFLFQGHNMKEDYEAIALAKAEAKGPKEVAHYKKKLAKDIKNAQKALKV